MIAIVEKIKKVREPPDTRIVNHTFFICQYIIAWFYKKSNILRLCYQARLHQYDPEKLQNKNKNKYFFYFVFVFFMQNTLWECPVIMDEIEFWIKSGIYEIINWQLMMIWSISYQDCINYKENYKTYILESKKNITIWKKEKAKQDSLPIKN